MKQLLRAVSQARLSDSQSREGPSGMIRQHLSPFSRLVRAQAGEQSLDRGRFKRGQVWPKLVWLRG